MEVEGERKKKGEEEEAGPKEVSKVDAVFFKGPFAESSQLVEVGRENGFPIVVKKI